jgi:hypothetical protein
MKTIGSRAEVWHGNAKKTVGGLTKKKLFKSKGRIRSRRASKAARKNKNLGSYKRKKGSKGFGPKN